jgi:hypothetical protein
MRRIVVSMWTTLDGYVAGPQDEMPWLALDGRMMEYEISLVSDAEALLLGRITHGDFAGSWPNIAKDESEAPATRAYAQRVDALCQRSWCHDTGQPQHGLTPRLSSPSIRTP